MKLTKSKTPILTVSGAVIFSAVSIQAAEYTVKPGEFKQTIQLKAMAMPEMGGDAGYTVSIKPEVWKAFKIEKFLPHGSKVKKGDKLIWIDTQALDKKIEESVKEREKQKLALNKAEMELEELRASTQESLTKAELEYERFLENYDYYKKVTKPQMTADVDYTVERAKNFLSYSQEELDQLLKMYDEDGLTEETEEIIIKRAKHGLTRSQKNLENEERVANYQKTIKSPRSDADWATSAVTEKRNFELTKKKLPLELKIKELDFEKLKRNDVNAEKQLNDLKADRDLMEFQSPAAGLVYLGEFKDGKWLKDAASKVLRKGGDVPSRMTLLTIVPTDTKLKFNAFLSEKQKRNFNADQNGNLRLESNPWVSTPVKASFVSEYPNFSHQWLVSFSPKEGAGSETLSDAMIGSKANISIVTANADDVLSVPTSAVKSNPDGTYSVKVKMAEGEPKVTEVVLGRQAGDKVEIISGLENDQVIITP